jgi:hypothetical protein
MIRHDRSASVDKVCPSKGRAYRPGSEKRWSSNAGRASRRPDAKPRGDLSQVWIKSRRDDDEPVSPGKSPDQLRMNSLHPTAFMHIAGNNGYDRASVRSSYHNSIFRHRVHTIHAMRSSTLATPDIVLLPQCRFALSELPKRTALVALIARPVRADRTCENRTRYPRT